MLGYLAFLERDEWKDPADKNAFLYAARLTPDYRYNRSVRGAGYTHREIKALHLLRRRKTS